MKGKSSVGVFRMQRACQWPQRGSWYANYFLRGCRNNWHVPTLQDALALQVRHTCKDPVTPTNRPQPENTTKIAWSLQVLFLCLFYVAFNTVQVISRRVVGRAEETSTYSSLGFCTVNCRPTASNYQLSHLRPCRESNPGLRGGRRECYHSATVAPPCVF